MSGYVFITIEKSSPQEADYFTNLAEPNSEFWQIGNTVISVRGFAFDKNNIQPEQYKNYVIEFVKDGFKFRIEGKNLEFMKQEIVKNYFPEYTYDDIFLISKSDFTSKYVE